MAARGFSVQLERASYEVHVGAGLLDRAGSLLPLARHDRLAVIVDPGCAPWIEPLRQALAGRSASWVALPAGGEAIKGRDGLAFVHDALAAAGLGRRDAVLAVGGGAVGDLTGFAAATWLRGIAWYVAPTTLLSQVDSAVGGKTAIDLPAGKNLVGAFHQPGGVLADTAVLDGLPPRELASGYAEVVKTALAVAPEVASLLDRCPLPALPAEPLRSELIAACAEAKARVVEGDETEQASHSRSRKVLNFGHTVGHALEAVTGYAHFRHGEAVAHGMSVALALSERLGVLEADHAPRCRALIDRLAPPPVPPLALDAVLAALARDKKRAGAAIEWVLLERPGSARIVRLGLDEPVVRELVADLLAREGAFAKPRP